MGGARRAQLALEWTDEIRWDDVPSALRAQLRAVLRELLQRAARLGPELEGGHDE
jgi:hypothetical protein